MLALSFFLGWYHLPVLWRIIWESPFDWIFTLHSQIQSQIQHFSVLHLCCIGLPMYPAVLCMLSLRASQNIRTLFSLTLINTVLFKPIWNALAFLQNSFLDVIVLCWIIVFMPSFSSVVAATTSYLSSHSSDVELFSISVSVLCLPLCLSLSSVLPLPGPLLSCLFPSLVSMWSLYFSPCLKFPSTYLHAFYHTYQMLRGDVPQLFIQFYLQNIFKSFASISWGLHINECLVLALPWKKKGLEKKWFKNSKCLWMS